MRAIHERAVTAAHNAAWAASSSEHWLTAGKTGKDIKKARDKAEPELLRFVLDNAGAPPEALYIRAGALGLHEGQPFAEAAPETRIGYQTFVAVFLAVSDAFDRQAAEEAAAEEAAARAAAPVRQLTEDDLEGTPFEKLPDPLAPSEFAKAAHDALLLGTGVLKVDAEGTVIHVPLQDVTFAAGNSAPAEDGQASEEKAVDHEV